MDGARLVIVGIGGVMVNATGIGGLSGWIGQGVIWAVPGCVMEAAGNDGRDLRSTDEVGGQRRTIQRHHGAR